MANKGFLIRTAAQGFQPLDHADFDSVKNGQMIEVKWSKPRNPLFHKKMFALFRLVYESLPERHYRPVVYKGGEKIIPHQSFDSIRRWLIVQAGYYDVFGYPDGAVRVEAKSISFGSMDQTEFEKLYSKIIDVALEVLPMYQSSTQLDSAVENVLRFDS